MRIQMSAGNYNFSYITIFEYENDERALMMDH